MRQKALPAQAVQRQKRPDAEEDLLAQEASGQDVEEMVDGNAGAQTLPSQAKVLYAQTITGSDVVTDAGAGSTALQQATHNTWVSGVHQITVDTDGNGANNGTEASRLFLVASGTAQTTDTGLASQNYSVFETHRLERRSAMGDYSNGVAWAASAGVVVRGLAGRQEAQRALVSWNALHDAAGSYANAHSIL